MRSLKYLELVGLRRETEHRFPLSMADVAWDAEVEVLPVTPCAEEVLNIALSRAFGTDSSLENYVSGISHPISPEKGKE